MTIVQLCKILDELLWRHLSLLQGLVVEVGVEQHDGAGEGVHGVVGLEGLPPQEGVALKESLTKVKQNPLPILGLPSQTELQ